MPDRDSRNIDAEIVRFIRRYPEGKAPEKAFSSLAFKVFKYQFDRNRYYRKFCRLEGAAPGKLKNWKDIPAMPAQAFKELVLTSFPCEDSVRVFRTSGTSREPKGAHFFDTLKVYEHSLLPAFKNALLPDGGKYSFYFLMPSAKEAPQSSLSYMMAAVDRRFAAGRGKFCVKKGVPRYAELFRALKNETRRVLLLSTAFALKGFLDFLAEKKLRLCLPAGSRLMETGGFKGRTREISKKALYEQCTRRLGVLRSNCVSEYGMTELSSQMYAPASGRFKGPAWLRTLVIDPRTGKEARRGATGLLRHLDLANRGSVMAVQTEDLGRAVGDGFELLGRAAGAEVRGCSLHYEEFIKEGI